MIFKRDNYPFSPQVLKNMLFDRVLKIRFIRINPFWSLILVTKFLKIDLESSSNNLIFLFEISKYNILN